MTANWANKKEKLIPLYGKRCFYCGVELLEYSEIVKETPLGIGEHGFMLLDVERGDYRTMATVDHIIPRSKGGKDNLENLVPCCFSCNAKKKDK